MLCESCGKNLRAGSVFCGKCGAKVLIKCPKCAVVADDDDSFCIKCGTQLPESPFAIDASEDEEASKQAKAPKKQEAKQEMPLPPPEPIISETPPEPPVPVHSDTNIISGSWRLSSGKELLAFYDEFSYKVGFIIEEEEHVDGTHFMLKASGHKILIWDEKQNGIKLEGFYKDGKRVSFWVNIQKNGSNDTRNSVGGIDEVVLTQLDSIHTFMEYYNPSLITAIELIHAKYCR